MQEGDTVLDLGSGAGKVCWIAAQIAGPKGKVIGVDMNTDMLGLAKQHHVDIAKKVGFDTVSYRRGMIQDLKLDMEAVEREPPKQADQDRRRLAGPSPRGRRVCATSRR